MKCLATDSSIREGYDSTVVVVLWRRGVTMRLCVRARVRESTWWSATVGRDGGDSRADSQLTTAQLLRWRGRSLPQSPRHINLFMSATRPHARTPF